MSRFINYLRESYHSGHKLYGRYLEVFKNPSRSEIGLFNKTPVRFVALHNKKDLYIWDSDAIHDDIMTRLDNLGVDFGDSYLQDSNNLTGVADVYKGKLIFVRSDQVEYDLIDPRKEAAYVFDLLEQDWSWLRKYFSDLSHLDKLRKKIK